MLAAAPSTASSAAGAYSQIALAQHGIADAYSFTPEDQPGPGAAAIKRLVA